MSDTPPDDTWSMETSKGSVGSVSGAVQAAQNTQPDNTLAKDRLDIFISDDDPRVDLSLKTATGGSTTTDANQRIADGLDAFDNTFERAAEEKRKEEQEEREKEKQKMEEEKREREKGEQKEQSGH